MVCSSVKDGTKIQQSPAIQCNGKILEDSGRISYQYLCKNRLSAFPNLRNHIPRIETKQKHGKLKRSTSLLSSRSRPSAPPYHILRRFGLPKLKTQRPPGRPFQTCVAAVEFVRFPRQDTAAGTTAVSKFHYMLGVAPLVVASRARSPPTPCIPIGLCHCTLAREEADKK